MIDCTIYTGLTIFWPVSAPFGVVLGSFGVVGGVVCPDWGGGGSIAGRGGVVVGH